MISLFKVAPGKNALFGPGRPMSAHGEDPWIELGKVEQNSIRKGKNQTHRTREPPNGKEGGPPSPAQRVQTQAKEPKPSHGDWGTEGGRRRKGTVPSLFFVVEEEGKAGRSFLARAKMQGIALRQGRGRFKK